MSEFYRQDCKPRGVRGVHFPWRSDWLHCLKFRDSIICFWLHGHLAVVAAAPARVDLLTGPSEATKNFSKALLRAWLAAGRPSEAQQTPRMPLRSALLTNTSLPKTAIRISGCAGTQTTCSPASMTLYSFQSILLILSQPAFPVSQDDRPQKNGPTRICWRP